MNASEMTNDELTKELDNVLVNDKLQAFADVDHQQEVKCEAVKRLRKIDATTCRFALPNGGCKATNEQTYKLAELQRCLNVAEKGLEAAEKIIGIWCSNPAYSYHRRLN